MNRKLFAFLLSIGLFVAATLSAQVNFDRINAQVENNPQLARALTQFNVSNHSDSAVEIVAFLSEQHPELTCNICLGAFDALEDPDEETVRAILEAAFAANPELAEQVGESVAGVYEDWEPLIASMLADRDVQPADERRVDPPQEPVDEDLPPEVITPLDSVIASPN